LVTALSGLDVNDFSHFVVVLGKTKSNGAAAIVNANEFTISFRVLLKQILFRSAQAGPRRTTLTYV